MAHLDRGVATRVAIVGAGYAGMAAAVSLAGSGVPVTVFESSAVAGGRARRIRISCDGQGHDLDNGQHILIGAYAALYQLMHTVGVADRALLRLPLEIRYVRDFHLRRGAWGLAGGLLGARGLPLRERLGAVRFAARLRLAGYRLAHDVSVA